MPLCVDELLPPQAMLKASPMAKQSARPDRRLRPFSTINADPSTIDINAGENAPVGNLVTGSIEDTAEAVVPIVSVID